MPASLKKFIEAFTTKSNLGSAKAPCMPCSHEENGKIVSGSVTPNSNFQACKIARHGFPNNPSSLAYDPVQQLLAIGCHFGSIRILGQAGVDCHITHESDSEVIQLMFLANQGALVSVCADNSIHLWNFRQKKPAILHSLNFKRESITFCHLPHQSSWIYVGTSNGNTNICNIETFNVSGYAISWNKAIDLSQRSHPGAVVCVSENPVDENKVLICFETGTAVLWDLKNQVSEQRYKSNYTILSCCWHSEGKQFICSHKNGSLSTWNCKHAQPVSETLPHAKNTNTECKPITKVQWLSCRFEDFVIFSGGLPVELNNQSSVTVMRGRSILALEVGHKVVDFTALTSTPWACDFQNPRELAILTENELVIVDLDSADFPSIESTHPMDIHDSPVTCLKYVPDPSTDLTPGLYQTTPSKACKKKTSRKNWPIGGGEWSAHACDGVPELIVTGHADGTVRFWDATAVLLKSIYKLRTKKIFKKDTAKDVENPFQINHISLCPESRTLIVANQSCAVVTFKFAAQEILLEISVLRLPAHDLPSDVKRNAVSNDAYAGNIVNEFDNAAAVLEDKNQLEFVENLRSGKIENCEVTHERNSYVKVKPGKVRQGAGFQANLICLLCSGSNNPSVRVTSIATNTSYQLLSIGTTSSVYVIDMYRKVCLFNVFTAMILRSIDKRIQVKSPNVLKPNSSAPSAFTFDPVQLPVGETPEVNGKQGEPKTKWKNVAKKSRNTTKSIGDYFTQSRSLLTFRRSSLLPPKSPLNVFPPELKKQRSHANLETYSSSLLPSPDQENPPSPEDVSDTFENSEEQSAGDKIRFSLGENENKKLEPEPTQPQTDLILSRASSGSDSESISSNEHISFMLFANNYTKQSEDMLPCLWVGTGGGHLISFIVHLPPTPEQRAHHAIVVSPSSPLLLMKGGIVHCNFIDSSGHLMHAGAGNWRDHACSESVSLKRSTSTIDDGLNEGEQPTVDKQFMVVCSEQQAKVFTLPSQICIHAVSFNASSAIQVVNSSADPVLNGTCLTCVTAHGHLMVYGLPSLNILLDTRFFLPNDPQLQRSVCFGVDGQAIYLATPSEIQRFTYLLDTFEEMQDFLGHLFVPRKSPERPNVGFLKSLFGSGYVELDREELFGESGSGRASRGVAQHVPGSGQSSFEGLRVAHNFERLQMQMRERGEKVAELQDKSEEMGESAKKFAAAANTLMAKYNKKWYQI